MLTQDIESFVSSFLTDCKNRIETKLEEILPKSSPTDLKCDLYKAMRYSCLNGGKRLRAALVYATAELFKIEQEKVDAAACAIELIHAYSLVHDDLPAMDDDALRRGKPSCHIAYNEATAILTGDALLTLAFEILSNNTNKAPIETHAKMINTLASAAGPLGMVLGQSLDIAATDNSYIKLETLKTIHNHKTGALIQAAVLLPIIAANTKNNEEIIIDLGKFAQKIGLAFQIKDDLLEVTKTSLELGKSSQSDEKQNKSTYVSLLTKKETEEQLNVTIEEAFSYYKKHFPKNTNLYNLALYFASRDF